MANTAPHFLESNNWSGAIMGTDKLGVTFKSISAEITIPNITFPNGYNRDFHYGSSFWLGFSGFNDYRFCDDVTGPKGLWQAGFYYLFDPEGYNNAYPFYEWWPDKPTFWGDDSPMSLIPMGHRVRITITQSRNITGSVLMENLTNGLKLEAKYDAPNSGINTTICGTEAEWIIENFANTLYPDFGTLKVEKMTALMDDGRYRSMKDTHIINGMPWDYETPDKRNQTAITECDVNTKDNEMTCKWKNEGPPPARGQNP